jgi:hypothetical protein
MPDGTFRLKKSVPPDILKTIIKKQRPKPKKIHEQLEFIKRILRQNEVEFIEEHRFCERLWRFDIACKELMIAIEYEGLSFDKTGHTTSEGFTKNCEKYNMATVLGWRLLRYTFLNYKDFEKDLKAIMYKNDSK